MESCLKIALWFYWWGLDYYKLKIKGYTENVKLEPKTCIDVRICVH